MCAKNRWTEEVDVIVVGYGGAGAVTAIAAHDAGARVIILEKQLSDTATETNHTPNTRMSGGAFCGASDREKASLYLEGMVKVANETLDTERKEILNVFAQYLVDNGDWLRSIGVGTGDIEQFQPIIKERCVSPTFQSCPGLIHPAFTCRPPWTVTRTEQLCLKHSRQLLMPGGLKFAGGLQGST
jgi:hypothetical protein